jgi:hypothetical protein
MVYNASLAFIFFTYGQVYLKDAVYHLVSLFLF